MKGFERIDWNEYNRPPFLPHWLCRGETKKLAAFGDPGLAVVDGEILAQKDRWDLDAATGAQLDRVGALLDVQRNGNTDDYYRLLLRLKILINRNRASVNDIIKVIKFYYSSETVEIKRNYPAGITILHDGEGPPIDFNRIMAQVVGAGIAFDTQELFYFLENLDLSDFHATKVTRNAGDFVTQMVFRNGRVLRDGSTVFDTELKPVLRNGTISRNGEMLRNGSRTVPATGVVEQPVYRRSGMQDVFTMGMSDGNHVDAWKSRLFRNASAIRDGTETRSGLAAASINEAVGIVRLRLWMSDSLPISETLDAAALANAEDAIDRNIPRDGRHRRNEGLRRSSLGMADPFEITDFSESGVADGLGIGDDMLVGLYHHYFRDGARGRTGAILRKGMVFIPLE